MTIRRLSVPLTTNSSGAATGYSPEFSGLIHAIQYVKTDFADGVDFTITVSGSGLAVLALTDQNAAGSWMPRAGTHLPGDGSALLYAAGGQPVSDRIASFNDKLKVVIAQGGDTKTGMVHVLYEN